MKIKTVFKTASAIFALTPGLGVMLKTIELPPGVSSVLFGAIVEAVGIFSLLILFIVKDKIALLPPRRVIYTASSLFACFIGAFFCYFYLINDLLIHNVRFNADVFFPLWHSPKLNEIIASSGGKDAAINDYGPDGIREIILQSQSYLDATRMLMCIIFISIFELLILSFGIVGFKLGRLDLTDVRQ